MMNIFFKSKQAQAKELPSSSSSHHHHHHLLMNNLKTHFTNFIRTHIRPPPWARIVDDQFPLPNSSDHDHMITKSSSTMSSSSSIPYNYDEWLINHDSLIQRRFAAVPVYRVGTSSSSMLTMPLCRSNSEVVDRFAAFYYFNEADAEAMLSKVYSKKCNKKKGYQVNKVPLAELIENSTDMLDQPYDCRVRMVPDISQVKNALQLIRKRHERNNCETAGCDESFTGVPIFQSKAVRMRVDGSPGNLGPPAAFFRKEDLEKAVREENKILNHMMSTAPDLDHIIEVTPLEEIIQDMQVCSKSKWNDVVFIPPGGNVKL